MSKTFCRIQWQLLPKQKLRFPTKFISNRIISITLKTNIRCKTIQIINSYAPHNGYSKIDQIDYWNNIKHILKQTNNKQCTIWATDNNGQIAHDNKDINNIIGPWTTAQQTEPGNGQMLKKYCQKFEMVATNTLYTKKRK